MTTKIAATALTEKALDGVMASIGAVREALPFAYELTTSEKRGMAKITTGTAYFVEDSLNSARENPAFVPAYINLDELENSLLLFKQLSRVLTSLQQMVDLVESTLVGTGSDAYSASLSYYQNVKQAAKSGVPGAQAIYELLKGRFDQSGATASVSPASNPPAPIAEHA
ncbi:MAG: hypothetical protein JWL59_4955 [Chthoniobacteraceae bacterium]|nr:hypothetical protein [Chthoniobacteraceae bacterium]